MVFLQGLVGLLYVLEGRRSALYELGTRREARVERGRDSSFAGERMVVVGGFVRVFSTRKDVGKFLF